MCNGCANVSQWRYLLWGLKLVAINTTGTLLFFYIFFLYFNPINAINTTGAFSSNYTTSRVAICKYGLDGSLTTTQVMDATFFTCLFLPILLQKQITYNKIENKK